MLPEALVYEYAPLQDCRALMQLARWMLRFSPLVALDREVRAFLQDPSLPAPPPLHYGITLNTTGTERCHGGEESLQRSVEEAIAGQGLLARTAIADNPTAAWALARFAKQRSTIVHGLTAELGELPVHALHLPEETCRVLRELGVQSIYDVLALPRSSLGVRFGAELLARIESLTGRKEEPFAALAFCAPHSAVRRFEVPLTSHAQILHACLDLLDRVVRKLLAAQEYAGFFIICMESLNPQRTVEVIRKEVSLYAARSSFDQLRSILTPIIESIRSAQGIRSISISAARTERATHAQTDFLQGARKLLAREGEDLLNRLLAQLGSDRVATARFLPSYIPERSFAYTRLQCAVAPPVKKDLQEGIEACAQRPPYLFAAPQPVSVLAMLPDTPPTRLTWDGVELRVLKGVGPEKICAEWWHKELSPALDREREYFRVQDETGRWLWLFRARSTMRWYVHGVWV